MHSLLRLTIQLLVLLTLIIWVDVSVRAETAEEREESVVLAIGRIPEISTYFPKELDRNGRAYEATLGRKKRVAVFFDANEKDSEKDENWLVLVPFEALDLADIYSDPTDVGLNTIRAENGYLIIAREATELDLDNTASSIKDQLATYAGKTSKLKLKSGVNFLGQVDITRSEMIAPLIRPLDFRKTETSLAGVVGQDLLAFYLDGTKAFDVKERNKLALSMILDGIRPSKISRFVSSKSMTLTVTGSEAGRFLVGGTTDLSIGMGVRKLTATGEIILNPTPGDDDRRFEITANVPEKEASRLRYNGGTATVLTVTFGLTKEFEQVLTASGTAKTSSGQTFEIAADLDTEDGRKEFDLILGGPSLNALTELDIPGFGEIRVQNVTRNGRLTVGETRARDIDGKIFIAEEKGKAAYVAFVPEKGAFRTDAFFPGVRGTAFDIKGVPDGLFFYMSEDIKQFDPGKLPGAMRDLLGRVAPDLDPRSIKSGTPNGSKYDVLNVLFSQPDIRQSPYGRVLGYLGKQGASVSFAGQVDSRLFDEPEDDIDEYFRRSRDGRRVEKDIIDSLLVTGTVSDFRLTSLPGFKALDTGLGVYFDGTKNGSYAAVAGITGQLTLPGWKNARDFGVSVGLDAKVDASDALVLSGGEFDPGTVNLKRGGLAVETRISRNDANRPILEHIKLSGQISFDELLDIPVGNLKTLRFEEVFLSPRGIAASLDYGRAKGQLFVSRSHDDIILGIAAQNLEPDAVIPGLAETSLAGIESPQQAILLRLDRNGNVAQNENRLSLTDLPKPLEAVVRQASGMSQSGADDITLVPGANYWSEYSVAKNQVLSQIFKSTTSSAPQILSVRGVLPAHLFQTLVKSRGKAITRPKASDLEGINLIAEIPGFKLPGIEEFLQIEGAANLTIKGQDGELFAGIEMPVAGRLPFLNVDIRSDAKAHIKTNDKRDVMLAIELPVEFASRYDNKPLKIKSMASLSLGKGQRDFGLTVQGDANLRDLVGYDIPGLGDLALNDLRLAPGMAYGSVKLGPSQSDFAMISSKDTPMVAIASSELTADILIPGLDKTPLAGLNISQSTLLYAKTGAAPDLGKIASMTGLPEGFRDVLNRVGQSDIPWSGGLYLDATSDIARSPVISKVLGTLGQSNPKPVRLYGTLPGDVLAQLSAMGWGKSTKSGAAGALLAQVNLKAGLPDVKLPGAPDVLALRKGEFAIRGEPSGGDGSTRLKAGIAGTFDLRVPLPAEKLSVDGFIEVDAGTTKRDVVLRIDAKGVLGRNEKPFAISGNIGLGGNAKAAALDWTGDINLADLSGLDVPVLSELTLSTARISTREVSGQVELAGAQTVFSIFRDTGAKLPVLALAQKQFDAVRLIPGIAGTPLDNAVLENGALVLAPPGTSGTLEADELPEIIAAALSDKEAAFSTLALKEGLNLSVAAAIKDNSPLGKALGTVGTGQRDFRFSGQLPARQLEGLIKGQKPQFSPDELRDVALYADVPEISIPHVGKVVALQSSRLSLTGTDVLDDDGKATGEVVVKLAANGGLILKLPGKELQLDGKLAFEKNNTATRLLLSGYTPVNWERAFGIPFLTLDEMRVSADLDQANSQTGIRLASATKVLVSGKSMEAKGDIEFSSTGLKDVVLALENDLSVGDLPVIGTLPLINEFSLKSAQISRAGLVATVDWPVLGLNDVKLSAQKVGGSNVGLLKLPGIDLARLIEKAGGAANSVLSGIKLPEAGLILNSSAVALSALQSQTSDANPLSDLLASLPSQNIESGMTLVGRIGRENLPKPVADILASQLHFFDMIQGDLIVSGRIGNLLKKSGAFELAADLPRFKFPDIFEIPGVLALDDTNARFAVGADLTKKTAHLGVYSDLSLQLNAQKMTLSGGIGVAKQETGMELALTGRSLIDWKGAFGLPFVDLEDIGLRGRLASIGGGKQLDVGLDATTRIDGHAVKGLWEIQARDGALKDVVLSIENDLKLADVPFIKNIPGIGSVGDFQIANASISMRGLSANVKWSSLGLDGKTAFFSSGKQVVAMMEVPDLDFAAFGNSAPGEIKKILDGLSGLKFPKAVLSFSSGRVDNVKTETLPDVAGDMVRGIYGDDAVIQIPDGVAMMASMTPDDLPTSPVDLKNMLTEDLGLFGPSGARIDRLILAGGLGGILSGNPNIYLAAKLPKLEFGDDLKSFASLVNFDRAGSEFFLQFSLEHLATRVGVAGNVTLDIPRLAQPDVRDKVAFKGSLLASIDAVSWAGAFKLTGAIDGDWRSPLGINDNVTLRKAAITVGGDPDGSAEFGIKSAGQWRLLDPDNGGKKNFDFTSEFVTSINFAAAGIPIPKKLGINLEFGEQTELSMLTQLELMDAAMRGVLTGPLSGEIAKGLGPAAANGFNTFKGTLNDSNTSLVKVMQLDKLPLRLLSVKGAQVMFRTPGAVIPGEEGESTVGFVTKGRFFARLMGQAPRELGALDNRLTFKDGLKVYGDLKPIKLGLLDLRQANIDIGAGLNPITQPPHFKLAGEVSLFPGTYDRTVVNLSKDQISFRIVKDYGEIGKLDIKAETPEGANLLSSDTDFIVKATGETGIDNVLFEQIFPVLKIPPAVETWLKQTTPLFISGFSFEGAAKSFIKGNPLILSVKHKIFGDPDVPDVTVTMEPIWKTGKIQDLFLGSQVIDALGKSFFSYLQEHPQKIRVNDLGPLRLAADAELSAATVEKNGEKQNALVLKAKANMLGLTDKSVIISLLPTHFVLRTTDKLAGLFKSDIFVWSEGGSILIPERVEYWADVDNGLTDWLQVKMGAVISKGRDEVNKNLDIAQKNLARAKSSVENIERQIESKREKVRGQREQGASLLRRARDTVSDQKAKLSSLENTRNNLRRQRLAAESSWNVFEKLKIPGLWIAEQGVVVAITIARETLNIVESGLEVAARTVENFPVDLHPEVAPLIFAKSTALAAVAVADTSVKAAQSVANNTITLADKLLQGAIKPANLNIKRATMKGALAANIVDTKGELYLEGDFWNHNDIETKIAFDVGRPQNTQIGDLARLFLALFENQEVTFFRRTAPKKPTDIARLALNEEELAAQREQARIDREQREKEEAERLKNLRADMIANARGKLPNSGKNLSLRQPNSDQCLTMTGRDAFDSRFKEIALRDCVGGLAQAFTFKDDGFVAIGDPAGTLCLDHYNNQIVGYACNNDTARRYMVSEGRITQQDGDSCFEIDSKGVAQFRTCNDGKSQRFEAVYLHNLAMGRDVKRNGGLTGAGLTDGNTSANVETPAALTPTVMIDLGKVYRIDRVKLFGIDHKTADLVMMISADPFDGVPVWSWPNDDIKRYRTADLIGGQGFLTDGVEGRYIMLTREAYGALNLAEVTVFGEPKAIRDGSTVLPVRNIARGKKAWQRYDDRGSSAASYAVDGNSFALREPGRGLNGSWMESRDGNLWWEVDLGGYYPIREVRLHAHSSESLMDTEVLLTNEPIGRGLYRGFTGDGVIRLSITTDQRQAGLSFKEDVARYVRVRTVNGTGLGLAEVEVMSTGREVSKPPAPPKYENLALNTAAMMSRQLASATVAANGNDGVVGQEEDQMAYAQADRHPWWQVDLGANYRIERIVVDNYNRNQPVLNRMNGARVFISQYPIETQDLSVLEKMPSIRTLNLQGGHKTYDLGVPDGTYGRYVRIQARSNEYLNFAELSVLSRNPAGKASAENLAAGKSVSASSSYPDNPPERGVDNWMGGLFHSTEEYRPWWEVDLGGHYPIELVRIFNRTDCCFDRLSDVRVTASNYPFSRMDDFAFYDHVAKGDRTITLSNQPVADARFVKNGKPVTARYIRLQAPDNRVLNFREVQVFGQNVPAGYSEKDPYGPVPSFEQAYLRPANYPYCMTLSGNVMQAGACDQKFGLFRDGTLRLAGNRGKCLSEPVNKRDSYRFENCDPVEPRQKFEYQWVSSDERPKELRDKTSAKIRNLSSGLCIDMASSRVGMGTRMLPHECASSSYQEWAFTPHQDYHLIKSAFGIESYGSGRRRLDVNSRREAVIYRGNGDRSQQWEMIGHPADSRGTFRLRRVANGSCLEPEGTNSHAKIKTYSCRSTTKGQLWRWSGDRLQHDRSGLCMDIRGASDRDMTDLILYSCHNDWNQKWRH